MVKQDPAIHDQLVTLQSKKEHARGVSNSERGDGERGKKERKLLT